MADELRLLMEIKGDLGETYGLVTAVRSELAEHRQDDISRLDRIDGRLGTIERNQAEAIGAARHRERGELRQAGVIAALVSGAVTALGNLLPHWWGR
jgi:hypothetical protein